MLIEDLLVIDAATIYPRFTRAGKLYSLDVIDGATIKPLIGEDGRAPEAPDPAYQQILHGVPAADFSADELLYLPRNVRTHKLYGMSPVEQIALTVNIALRRDVATLDYYRAGSLPDAFGTVPKEWTGDQVRAFQDYFDGLMSGNLHRRRMLKFMPADFRLVEYRQPPLKDMYDEWLARIICYAFSVPASAFVSQVNRATSETLRLQATQEGLVPLKTWIKSALDQVIQVCDGRARSRIRLGRRRRDRPAAAGPDAEHFGERGHQDARRGAGGAGVGRDVKAGPAAAGKAPTEPVAKRNFDPNQPRDEHGMWTTEGGSETQGTTKPNESDAPATREHNQGTDTVPAAMQSLALADIGTLVAQQNLGKGITICIYRSNVFGHYFQILSDTGICPQTAPNPN